MGITEILDSGADVTLKIKSKDLKDFAEHLIEKSIKGLKESFVRPEERYLTIKEVAEKLHVDPSTLWSWDKRGYLRKIEVGGKRLYRESDVEAILNRK